MLALCFDKHRMSEELLDHLNAYFYVNRCVGYIRDNCKMQLSTGYTSLMFDEPGRLLPTEMDDDARDDRKRGIKETVLAIINLWSEPAVKFGIKTILTTFLQDIFLILYSHEKMPVIVQDANIDQLRSQFLTRYQAGSQGLSFATLALWVQKFPLSESFVEGLASYFVVNKCDAFLQQYKTAWFSSWGVPTVLRGQVHSTAVETALATIQQVDGQNKLSKNRDYLIAFINLWSETTNKGGYQVNPKVTEILQNVHQLAIKCGAAEVKSRVQFGGTTQ